MKLIRPDGDDVWSKGYICPKGTALGPIYHDPDEPEALDETITHLECIISIDDWLNKTARHAHVILPGLSLLEQPHYDEAIRSWAVCSAGNYSPAVFPSSDGRPEEWEILSRLGAYLAGLDEESFDLTMIDDGFLSGLCEYFQVDLQHVLSHYESGGPERMTDFMIRVCPWGDRYGENPEGLTLKHFKDNPHGIDMGPMLPRARDILHTQSV